MVKLAGCWGGYDGLLEEVPPLLPLRASFPPFSRLGGAVNEVSAALLPLSVPSADLSSPPAETQLPLPIRSSRFLSSSISSLSHSQHSLPTPKPWSQHQRPRSLLPLLPPPPPLLPSRLSRRPPRNSRTPQRNSSSSTMGTARAAMVRLPFLLSNGRSSRAAEGEDRESSRRDSCRVEEENF